MDNTIYKIFIILLITSIRVCDSVGQNLIQKDTSTILPLKPKEIVLLNNDNLDKDKFIQIQEQLVGCICDPVFPKIIGVSMIGSSINPYLGLGLDFNPLIYKKIVADLSYRYDFKHDFILSSGFESKYLIRRIPMDFRLEYNRFKVSQTNLDDYNNIFIGPVYKIPWTSIGLFVGKDNSQTHENIGYRMFFKYKIHFANNDCCKTYTSVADIYTSVDYWSGTINYKVKIDYLLNYFLSIGTGYEKIYDFKDFFITLRYNILYY